MKALAYHRDFEIKGHSIVAIAQALSINGDIESAGKILDQYYISSRSPDSLPSGAPFQFISEKQAQEAMSQSRLIWQWVRNHLV